MGKYKKSINNKYIKEYRAYKAMKSRCYSPSNSNNNYQKKNLTVSERWLKSFDNFMEDMGYAPSEKHSLDRIDNNDGYYKENCRWVLQDTQSNNRGNFNLLYTLNGITMTLKQWSRELNINYNTLYTRIFRKKLPFEQAIKIDEKDRLVEYKGEYKQMKDWCKLYEIPPTLAYDRKHRGWNIDRILNTPKCMN